MQVWAKLMYACLYTLKKRNTPRARGVCQLQILSPPLDHGRFLRMYLEHLPFLKVQSIFQNVWLHVKCHWWDTSKIFKNKRLKTQKLTMFTGEII